MQPIKAETVCTLSCTMLTTELLNTDWQAQGACRGNASKPEKKALFRSYAAARATFKGSDGHLAGVGARRKVRAGVRVPMQVCGVPDNSFYCVY